MVLPKIEKLAGESVDANDIKKHKNIDLIKLFSNDIILKKKSIYKRRKLEC